MTLQHIKLADPQQLPSTAGSLLANPASTKTFLRGFILYNSNTTTETVDIHVVPDSGGSLGSAAASNRICRLTLATNETLIVEFPFPIVLIDTNDAIFGVTTTASKVTFIPLGDKE